MARASRDVAAIEESARGLDRLCTEHLPRIEDAGWRENCEVFLVAIVVALAVRTFFLQPFTIPTGSMQPTLNGILNYPTQTAQEIRQRIERGEPLNIVLKYPTQTELPNVLTRLVQTALLGRTWVNEVAQDEETVFDVHEVTRFFFFTYSQVQTDRHTYLVHAPARSLIEGFGVTMGRSYQRGEPIARGYVETGDHVFVDKFTYHFRKPRRGDVFVFNTLTVPTYENRLHPDGPSQFYIKRLAGLPGDELRIDAPRLFVNGKLAEGAAFARVMAAKDGYGGYGFGFSSFLMPILRAADDPYTIPEKHYFAMGDNSYHSSDSRDWGAVPQQNIMGRGLFVYWPFTSHWGLIQ
jgi:signal peptidase I